MTPSFSVPGEPPFTVAACAVVELLHAELAVLATRAGVPRLHIKGPTVVRWLFPDGGRRWGDADVLVPNARLDGWLDLLHGHGFAEVFPGLNHHTTEGHAVVLARPGAEAGGVVDVHHRFPGIGTAPGPAFLLLGGRRERGRLGCAGVWFPDRSSRVLLVALNTARTWHSGKAARDLALLVEPAAQVDWDDVSALAVQLHAVPALGAGLEQEAAGREVVAATRRLAAVPVDAEWQQRIAGDSRTALRLVELRALAPGQQVRQLARWLLPHPGVIRYRDPRI